MQPRRKCRLTAERSNLAIELQKRFLGQILGFRRIRRHPQAQRIDPPLMAFVEFLKGISIALLGSFDGLGFAVVVARSLSWVGQVAFSGRTSSDAA